MTNKTARELRISDREYGALQAVRDKLASGWFQHMPEPGDYGWRTWLRPAARVFNMGQCMIVGDKETPRKSCGQVGCIGGWMGIEMGLNEEDAATYVAKHEDINAPMHNLFYPFTHRMDELTDKHAVKAIDHFLQGAKKPWLLVRDAPLDNGEDLDLD